MEFLRKIFCFPFTKSHSKNENFIVDTINFIESNNLNFEYYYTIRVINQEFGLCPECNQPNTWKNWCRGCNSKKFQQNFGNWTSGNELINKIIQESQLNARICFELLEWIPYNRLRNIHFLAQGGFSTVYEALWLDGAINKWDYKKQDWERFVNKLDEQ